MIDPYSANTSVASLRANKMVDGYADYLYYHSNQYFCSDRRVATNGGPGTVPEHPPRLGPRVNALLFQGMRDTLFNFSEGYANYQCLRREDGDVRLLSYQSGHNAAHIVPDPGEAYLPQGNVYDGECGSLHLTTAIGAFFAQYLQGVPGAANVVPTKPCLSIAKDDAVLVNQVMTLQSGGTTTVDVPATQVIAGTGLDQADRRRSWHRRRAGQFRDRRDSTCEAQRECSAKLRRRADSFCRTGSEAQGRARRLGSD